MKWTLSACCVAALIGVVACGDEVTIIGTPSGGGSTGEGGQGNTGNGGGAGFDQVDCIGDDECMVNTVCIDGVCSSGSCISTNSPAGTDCGNGAVCDGNGNCGDNTGGPCVDDSECSSGMCIDDVCCATDCAGECEACNVAGVEGTCSAVPAGSDPDDECTGVGVCDGQLECATGEHVWSSSYGADGSQFARDAAVDSMGNIVVIGYFFGTIDLGGGTVADPF